MQNVLQHLQLFALTFASNICKPVDRIYILYMEIMDIYCTFYANRFNDPVKEVLLRFKTELISPVSGFGATHSSKIKYTSLDDGTSGLVTTILSSIHM